MGCGSSSPTSCASWARNNRGYLPAPNRRHAGSHTDPVVADLPAIWAHSPPLAWKPTPNAVSNDNGSNRVSSNALPGRSRPGYAGALAPKRSSGQHPPFIAYRSSRVPAYTTGAPGLLASRVRTVAQPPSRASTNSPVSARLNRRPRSDARPSVAACPAGCSSD